MRVVIANRDVEITQLTAKIYQLSTEGLGTSNNMKTENKGLEDQVTTLTVEVKSLLDEFKDLTK